MSLPPYGGLTGGSSDTFSDHFLVFVDLEGAHVLFPICRRVAIRNQTEDQDGGPGRRTTAQLRSSPSQSWTVAPAVLQWDVLTSVGLAAVIGFLLAVVVLSGASAVHSLILPSHQSIFCYSRTETVRRGCGCLLAPPSCVGHTSHTECDSMMSNQDTSTDLPISVVHQL